MTKSPPSDTLALTPDGVAFHQVAIFTGAPETFVERVIDSDLFRIDRMVGRTHRVEWIRPSADDDSCPFPLARVTLDRECVLLEAFAESRLTRLDEALATVGFGAHDADETRVLRAADAIERPDALLQPLEDAAGRALSSRDVAALYLRMAWSFIPRADLSGRAPYVAVRTGRGRTALSRVLDDLPLELESWHPRFPLQTPDELRAVLFPDETAARPEPRPQAHPSPDDRRRS